MKPSPAPWVPDRDGPPPVVTPEIAAEASVWIARLHGPDRSSGMERECLQWQQRSAAHRLAFERCTETWQDVSRLTLGDAYASQSRPGPAAGTAARAAPFFPRARWPVALAVAGVLSVGVLLAYVGLQLGVQSTGVGEQHMAMLEDGTRMSLNTSSRVRVSMNAERRSVSVEEGEALFEVAKDARRPFVVRAGDSEVVAVGTVFSVRLDAGRVGPDETLTVSLMEGAVTVKAADVPSHGLAPVQPLSMHPGERVRLSKGADGSGQVAQARVDRPPMESVTAWRQGEAIFEDTPLAEAIAEMNRYHRTKIVLLGGSALANLRVSGVYRTGDTGSFAHDVAALHRLSLRERNGRLELTIPQ